MSRVGKSSKPRARRPARKRVQLPEALDLTAAAPLSQSLLTHRGKPLTIDASRVTRTGARGLQVLLAAAATWKADEVSIRLDKPSEEFLEGSRLLGISIDEHFAGRDQA